MMRRTLLGLIGAVCLGAPAQSDPAAQLAALIAPGTVALMRHALAPGTGDPSDFRLDDCSTQRNLDDRGRAQARAIGAALRRAGVVFDHVLTSQWCRCRETAELLDIGPVKGFPALNSFYETRSTAVEQTNALKAYLAALPPDETVMLVTHQVNITALTQQGASSGEIFLIRSGEAAGVLAGRVLIAP